MKRLLPLLLLSLCLYGQTQVVTLPGPSGPAAAQRDPEVEELLGVLSRMTGWKPLKPVDTVRITRAEVKEQIEERVREHVKPDEIRQAETALKKFGFVPQDFDLKRTTIELLSEQAAAFYDFHKRKLFMIDAEPGDLMQQTILVHELAHALADQHFDLEKYTESVKEEDDASLARQAALEGQAMWLMSEHLAQKSGQSLKTEPLLLKFMANSMGTFDTAQFPVFSKAPLYLKETLIFPYTKGMLFQHALIEKMGEAAFAEVFRRPPLSTQQIIHPEKYQAGVKPVKVAAPEPPAKADYTEFGDGDMGELDHGILLKQYAGDEESKALAPEWRGGGFRLLEHKKDKRIVLAYAVEWSSPQAAKRYFAAYRKVLQGKWKRLEVLSEAEGVLAGRGDDGYFVTRLDGVRVSSVEGLPAAAPVK